MKTTVPDLQAREAGPYSRHIPALDGVRGLAILGVMASHLFLGTHSGPWIVRVLEGSFTFGAYGVDLFFVLSGFLITGILYDSLADERFFRKFYARRALRIFPLYYGVLLLALVLTPWLGVAWHGMWCSLALYLQNTTLFTGPLADFHPVRVSFTHFWSLAVEEQFYLVWPMCVYFVRDRRRLLWICGGLSVVSVVLRFALALGGATYQTLNTTTLCRADSLLIGGALALLLRSEAHDRVLKAGRWLFLVAGVNVLARLALLDALHVEVDSPRTVFWAASFTLNYTLLALTSVGLVAWCLQPSVPQRVFKAKWLRFLGKYSYGLYVLHVLLLPTEMPIFRQWMPHVTKNKGLIVVGVGLLAFATSVILAYLSYHLYEKQFLKLKRYFDYKRTPARPA